MNRNEVSILLEILDLEYLKPILIDRFQTLDQLASVNLEDIGIQNPDDLRKIRYALDDIQQNKTSIEEYNPILSLNDSHHILTRIENETNLITSCLNLSLNNLNTTNIPRDDATSDIDYSLYDKDIDQIEADVEKLETNAQELMEQIQIQFPQLKRQQQEEEQQKEKAIDKYKYNINPYIKRTVFILGLSVLSVGLLFYIKRKK